MPGDQNKVNWKHGGSLADKNGIKYTIEPRQKRPPPPDAPFGHCKAPFRVLFYAVIVTGAGHLSSDWCKGLHKEFKNCGATMAWSFKYYDEPAEDGAEWEAYGQLPALISGHCARRAVDRAAGFSNKGQC